MPSSPLCAPIKRYDLLYIITKKCQEKLHEGPEKIQLSCFWPSSGNSLRNRSANKKSCPNSNCYHHLKISISTMLLPIRLPVALSSKFPGDRSNRSPACLK